MATGANLGYNTNASAMQMADAIFGDGVTVIGASYLGDKNASAIYTNGNLAPGVAPSDTGVILSTGRVRDFTNGGGDPNRSTSTSTNTKGVDNDPMFNAIAGAQTYDASILDVDFIPTGNVMTMQFVFSSEEYPEYVNSQFNDMLGVWINGTHVPLSVGTGQASVNNVNPASAPNLAVSNANDAYNTEMDGFTLTLSLTIPVNPGVVNSIRIGVADVSDSQYDSNLLIAGNSAQTKLVAIPDHEIMFPNQTKTIDVLGNDINTGGGTLTITHVNGVPVVPGQTVVLPSGDSVTVNADGTLTVHTDADTGPVHFTYGVANGTGQTATGMVNVTTIPCFVAGTMIATPEGERAVESLRPGDLVLTHDDGPQPVRWIGRRRVAARGDFAPIRIRAGTFGRHGTLLVSPQHRVMLRNSHAELLFGEAEVLIAAKDLVDGANVTVAEGGTVDYVHLLFDRHQVIYSEGLTTESFLPGPQTLPGFTAELLAELRALFPELDPATGRGYGAAARPALKSYEARLFIREGLAA